MSLGGNKEHEDDIKKLKEKILAEGIDVPVLSGFNKKVKCLKINDTHWACTCENCGIFYEPNRNIK